MKTSNSHSIKKENMKLVMTKLLELKETSRVELSKITTLTKATISSVVNEFIEKDLVVETNKNVKTGGRNAKVIALNKNAGRIISIELLPHTIYGVITNLFGEILFEISKPISSPEFQPYLKILLSSIDELKANTYESTYGLIGIGIAVFGILSKQKNIEYVPFNSWKDINLKEIIEKYTGIETFVENEANISALGEHISYPQFENIVALNIGLGVGAGIIINHDLYLGEHGYAGEIGHTIVEPNGNLCKCGNKGCLESYISETSILKEYLRLSGEKITIKEYVDKLKSNDAIAAQIYESFMTYVTIAINNLSQVLNPKLIVINSQIIENVPESISSIKNNLRSQTAILDILTTSQYTYRTNVLGISHALIQKFLKVD